MAQQSFANVGVDLSKVTDVLDEVEKYLDTGTTGLLATIATAKGTVTGDTAGETISALDALEEAGKAIVSVDAVRATLTPVLRELAASSEVDSDFAKAGADVEVFWDDLHQYMVDNSQSINAPADTYDTSASAGGSNVGNGTCLRLTVDENDETLWGLEPDSYEVKCLRDARQTGKAHYEQWRIRGTKRAGASDREMEPVFFDTITGAASQGSPLKNPGFDTATGTTTITALPGWRTNTDGASAVASSNIQSSTSHVYAPTTPGATTSKGIVFTADEILYQDFVVENNGAIDPDVPYLIAIRVKRISTATGTMTLRMSGTVGSGGISNTLSLASLSADTWGTLYLDSGSVGQECWPARWNANDLKFQIGVGSLSGTCAIDQAILVPLTRFGQGLDPRKGRGSMGQYVCYLQGSTAAAKDDTHSFTGDSESTRGVIAYWLKRGDFGYLPTNGAGSETIADS